MMVHIIVVLCDYDKKVEDFKKDSMSTELEIFGTYIVRYQSELEDEVIEDLCKRFDLTGPQGKDCWDFNCYTAEIEDVIDCTKRRQDKHGFPTDREGKEVIKNVKAQEVLG